MNQFYNKTITLFLVFVLSIVHAQTTGDFRSITSGVWNVNTSWQRYDGTTWANATAGVFPGSTAGSYSVTIQAGHIIDGVNGANYTIGNLTINGTLRMNTNNMVMTINTPYVHVNGGAINYNVSASNLVLSAGTRLDFSNGGAVTDTNACNANKIITIGTTVISSCSGGGAPYDFVTFNALASNISSTITKTDLACLNKSVQLSVAGSSTDVGATYSYSWSGTGPSGYTYGPSSTNPITINQTTPGVYTFTSTTQRTDITGFILVDVKTISYEVLLDSDSDCAPDTNDLDDDNDGILDTNEGLYCTGNIADTAPNPYGSGWYYNNSPQTRVATVVGSSPYIASATSQVDGSGLTSFLSATPSQSLQIFDSFVNQPNLAGAINNNDYIAMSFTTKTFTGNAYNYLVGTQLWIEADSFSPASNPNASAMFPYQFSMLVSTDASFATNVSNVVVDATVSYVGTRTLVQFVGTNLKLNSNTTYYIRFYIYNVTTSSDRLVFDDQIPLFKTCTYIDTDGDGIPNNLDLDSDNDGCSDANEYYNSATADGGDGGVYGTGTPTVDATGKVTTASYSSTTATNVTTAMQINFAQPRNAIAYVGGFATFTATATGVTTTTFSSGTPNYTVPPATAVTTGFTYQWQISTDNGATWTNVTDGGQYSGATTNTLTVNNLTTTQDGYLYRLSVTHTSRTCPIVSNTARLDVYSPCTVTAANPDSDGDGYADLCDLDDDNDGILDTDECSTGGSEIIANTDSGAIFKFNTLTGVKTPICTTGLTNLGDIAMNSAGELYGITSSDTAFDLIKIDPTTCAVSNVANIGPGNSLSFLPDGSLLVGTGSNSTVRRITNVGGTNTVSTWHNFGTGGPNGDFIVIGNKVYVLWFDVAINGTNPVILEVTIDASYNYISHTVLGPVERWTWGLAKANNNQLYGVSGIGNDGIPNPQGSIIKIDLAPFSWETIYSNNELIFGGTSKNESEVECDYDGDGIPNRLDLDSDNDGCPDALEANSNLNYTDLNSNGTINAAVGTTGIPNNTPAANAGSAYNASVKSAECNPCDNTSSLFVDSDADTVGNLCDSDDDNDGILDTAECTTNPVAVYAPNNFTDNTKFLTIRPSDFGLNTAGATNQTATKDYSSFYGLPVGSMVVQVKNANVHPTANVFYTSAITGKTEVIVSGTVGQYVVYNHGKEYIGTQERGFEFLEGTTIGLTPFNVQTTGGNWVSGNTGSYYYVRHTTNTTENASFFMANINPQVMTKKVIVSTNSVEPTEFSTFFISIFPECDTDKDGIPNRLDLDSDGDTCPDVIEGGASFQPGATYITGNRLNTTVNTSGVPAVPTVTPAITGYTQAAGQTVGDSQNASANTQCITVCYESPTDITSTVPVKHGITVLGRAGSDNGGWPMVRNSAYTVLESKTKGFVITRMTSDPTKTADANHIDKITAPEIGMMIFDTYEDGGKGCLKIYTGTAWKCFNKQTCP